jgi:hypothetical protein
LGRTIMGPGKAGSRLGFQTSSGSSVRGRQKRLGGLVPDLDSWSIPGGPGNESPRDMRAAADAMWLGARFQLLPTHLPTGRRLLITPQPPPPGETAELSRAVHCTRCRPHLHLHAFMSLHALRRPAPAARCDCLRALMP